LPPILTAGVIAALIGRFPMLSANAAQPMNTSAAASRMMRI
jgi:hypothetical protein